MLLTATSPPMSVLAACCMSLRARPASASCSTAPSASARRWRCRRRRTPASAPPATSPAASTPGRRRMGRYHGDPFALPAVGLGELGGVVELLELDDLAVADGEDVDPVAR